MEFLSEVMSWVKWLGITGIIVALLLLLFAPALAKVAGETLAPIGKALGEGVVWFFRDVLWEGFKDMTDNLASVAFVATAIILAGLLISDKCDPRPAVDKKIAELRQQYKFVPRTPAEQRAYRKQNQPTTLWNWWW